MPDWVAERRLQLNESGKMSELQVLIAAPIQMEAGGFGCTYKIVLTEEGNEIERTIFGADGFQAIQLATFMIASDLKLLNGTISWLGEPGHGFSESLV